jgi:quinol monooxygenase YgiN
MTMSEPVIYIDRSEIRAGKLEEVRARIKDLTGFIERNEPQLISYAVFVDDDGRHMTVIHVHTDVASLEIHMKVAGPLFGDFAELVQLLTIDVYGALGPELMSQLRQKAELLGGASVRTHELHVGFVRSPSG